MRLPATLLAAVALAVVPLAVGPVAAGPRLVSHEGTLDHGYDPREPQNLTWVKADVLALGGGGLDEDDVDWLHANGFEAVASFRGEHRDPVERMTELGIEHLWIDLDHGTWTETRDLETFLTWAAAQEAAGRTMYVHCTNGWHRGAAFATAWIMANEGLSYDEAAEEAVERRRGSVMRTPGALLGLEARLTGVPGLEVALVSDRSRPDPGGAMPVEVQVWRPDGAPAEGARVRLWTEGDGWSAEGVTDARGRFVADYRGAEDKFMEFLYARAALDGYTDGADTKQVFYADAVVEDAAVAARAEATAEGLVVRVEGGKREAAHPRVFAWWDGGFAAGHARDGVAVLPMPPPGADVRVRVEAWGSDGAEVRLRVPADAAPATPAGAAAPGAPAEPAPAEPGGSRVGAIASVGFALASVAAWVGMRRAARRDG